VDVKTALVPRGSWPPRAASACSTAIVSSCGVTGLRSTAAYPVSSRRSFEPVTITIGIRCVSSCAASSSATASGSVVRDRSSTPALMLLDELRRVRRGDRGRIRSLELVERDAAETTRISAPAPGRLVGRRRVAAHEETQRIPIVIVTGSNERLDETGYAAVLRKPVTPHELTMAVEQALAHAAATTPRGTSAVFTSTGRRGAEKSGFIFSASQRLCGDVEVKTAEKSRSIESLVEALVVEAAGDRLERVAERARVRGGGVRLERLLALPYLDDREVVLSRGLIQNVEPQVAGLDAACGRKRLQRVHPRAAGGSASRG